VSYKKEEFDRYTLYCGDCLEILPELSGVDAVVTDPPYGIGFKYTGAYNDAMPEYKYFGMLKTVFGACSPLPIAFFWPSIRIGQHENVLPSGYYLHHVAAHFRIEYAGDLWKGQHPAYTWEPIYWIVHSSIGGMYYGQVGGNEGRDGIPTLSGWREDNDGHPCPKAIKPVSRVTGWITDIGMTVLDPFMGSGTTGVACANLGRKFIGIEIEPKYYDIARKRISDAYAQGQLFEPEDIHQPEQQDLGL